MFCPSEYGFVRLKVSIGASRPLGGFTSKLPQGFNSGTEPVPTWGTNLLWHATPHNSARYFDSPEELEGVLTELAEKTDAGSDFLKGVGFRGDTPNDSGADVMHS